MKLLLVLVFVSQILITSNLNAQSFTGKLKWVGQFDVHSQISATVKKVHIKEGQFVNKGDLLITMDQSMLSRNLKSAEAILASEAVDKEKKEMDYNRALELYDRTLLSDVNLKKAEFDFIQAKALYDVALVKKENAEYLLKASEIKSPFKGLVLKQHITEGFYANNETSPKLLTLVKTGKLHAVTNLKISQWSRSLLNKSAELEVNNMTYSGKVSSIALIPSINTQGISEYSMVIDFKSKDLLPEGMPIKITIK